MAAHINGNAETQTKPKPKRTAEPISSTGTKTHSDTESHNSADRGDNVCADTDQTLGAGSTMKPKEAWLAQAQPRRQARALRTDP
jgi:hypothetical protein